MIRGQLLKWTMIWNSYSGGLNSHVICLISRRIFRRMEWGRLQTLLRGGQWHRFMAFLQSRRPRRRRTRSARGPSLQMLIFQNSSRISLARVPEADLTCTIFLNPHSIKNICYFFFKYKGNLRSGLEWLWGMSSFPKCTTISSWIDWCEAVMSNLLALCNQ